MSVLAYATPLAVWVEDDPRYEASTTADVYVLPPSIGCGVHETRRFCK